MKDISSTRNSQGFYVLRHQVQKLGREAYEKYGCNLVAILTDEPEPDCEGGLQRKPSMIYETPGASGFFDGHVRSDMNLLAEHLVAHVNHYEHREHGASRRKVSSRGDSNLSGAPDKDFGNSDDSNQWSDQDQDDFNCPNPRNRSLTRRGFFHTRRPHFLNAKKAIVNEATKAGVDIHWRVLPWKRLPDICANFGVYIDNYPDGLVSPFDYGPLEYLGIGRLSDDEHEMLIHALKHEKTCPMRFLRVEDAHDIMNNELPVLVYAPPPPDSPQLRSKRVFLDGTYDYEGHKRIEVVRNLDIEKQKRCRRRPRKFLYKSIQGLDSLDSVQRSVGMERLNMSYVDRPDKRNWFVRA